MEKDYNELKNSSFILFPEDIANAVLGTGKESSLDHGAYLSIGLFLIFASVRYACGYAAESKYFDSLSLFEHRLWQKICLYGNFELIGVAATESKSFRRPFGLNALKFSESSFVQHYYVTVIIELQCI